MSDDFAGFLANRRQQEAPAPESDLTGFLSTRRLQQTQEVQSQLQLGIEQALRENPDVVAERQRLSRTSGVPFAVVSRNLDELRVKEQARSIEMLRLAQNSPVLARQLADPTLLGQTHDHLENLSSIERTFGGTIRDVIVTAGKGAVGLPQAFVGLADIPTFGYAGKALESAGLRFNDAQKILDKSYSPAQRRANDAVQEADGFVETLGTMLQNPSTIATTIGQSIPQMLGGAALGRAILAGAPKIVPWLAAALGEGVLGAGSAAEQIRADTADGLLTLKQSSAAVLSGAGTALFGAAGGKLAQKLRIADIDTVLVSQGADAVTAKALKDGFVRSIVKAGISEGVFEEMPQSVQEQMWQNWATDKPLGQGVGKAAALGLLAGAATGAAVQGARRALQRQAEVTGAEDSANNLKAQFDLAAQALLRERNPDEFRTLVQSMADNTEGAPKEIYVDAEVLNQLAPELLNQLPQSVRDALPDALAANDVVAISTGDVLTIAPGTPLEQVLIENARIGDPMAMSQVEAKKAGAQAQQFLAQEAERVIQQASDQQAMQASSDRVKQGVLDQLNTVGRFRKEVNEGYATWTAAFYTTLAGRTGMTPEQMAAKYPLRVVGQSGQGAVLNAGGTLADVTQQWDAAGITNDVYENKGNITLSRIVVPESDRSTGKGTAALQALVDYADRTGQRVVLSPSADFGGNKKRLMEFYKRFGFVENKGRNKDFAVSETMIREPQVFNQSVTTMVPTTKGAVVDPAIVKVPGIAEAESDDPKAKAALAANVELFNAKVQSIAEELKRGYNSITVEGDTPKAQAESIINQMVRNLLTIYDAIPPEIRDRSRLWYDGANRISLAFAQRYNMTPMQAAAQLAVLSPQADWFMNVSYAERINDILEFQQDYTWDAEMEAWATDWMAASEESRQKETDRRAQGVRDAERGVREAVREAERAEAALEKNTPKLDEKIRAAEVALAEAHAATVEARKVAKKSGSKADEKALAKAEARENGANDKTKEARAALRAAKGVVSKAATAIRQAEKKLQERREFAAEPDANVAVQPAVRGKKLSELENDFERAWWVRTYDEVHHPRAYRIVTPEGGFLGFAKNDDGVTDGTIAWKSFNPIAKAIGIRRDGSLANVHAALGGEHKVRNFYNNIYDPNAPQPFVTSDTHQVAANLFLPLGADALEVGQNFGGTGTKSVGATGLNGTYWLYSEAVARAAAEVSKRGGGKVLPREMQSISWEAIRSLFSPTFKGDTNKVNAVRDLWDKHAAGEATYEDTIQAIIDLAGGAYRDPSWVGVRPDSAAAPEAGLKSYESELAHARQGLAERGEPGRGDAGVPGPALSQGEVLNQSANQTDTPEFQTWFDDSKVVDENGQPLVVYHGTTSDFFEFDISKSGSANRFGPGFYFTGDKRTFDTYGGKEGGNVMPVFLSMKNPQVGSALTEAQIKKFFSALQVKVFPNGYDATADHQKFEQRALENPTRAFDTLLSAQTGYISQADWLRGMDAIGVDGIVREVFGHPEYVVFRNTQIKSAIGNQGTFDAQDPNILRQGPRGTFSPKNLELALNENADLSTFLHETGHFFLEVMADLASQPGAPADIATDMAALMKWFGVADLATWNALPLDGKRPYHERFAESFEQYLMEGKAPSVELQPLFRKFRAWMLNVYKSLKAFVDGRTGETQIQLSPEIRQVFDRMLASEAQIAEANEVAGLLPNEEADAEANERLTARSLRDLKWTVNARAREIKKLQAQAKEQRKEVEAEVTAEVNAMPEFQAQAALTALQVNPDYIVALKIWTEQRAAALTAASEQLKADLLAANPDVKGLQKGQLLAKNKKVMANQAEAQALAWEAQNPKPRKADNASEADLAVIADSFGYPDADTMLQAIDAAGKKADVIEGMTDQRMLEQYGDLIDQRAIEAAANEAVHNEARARSLATELRSQAEMLNPRTDTGQVNAQGSRITVNALVEAAKQFAANVISRTPLKDLKSKAWQHTAAERRAGKRWAEATTKGETQEAVKAKQDQMLNNAAAKAAIDAQAEMRKMLEFFRRVIKDNNEKVVEKGRDPDVVNAARAVLAAYGVAPKAGKTALEYLALVEKNDPAMFAALQPSVQGVLNLAQPLDALTMDELRGLHEEIQAMWHLAKRSRQMEVDGNLLDIEDAEAELQDRMQEIGVPDTMPGDTGAVTPREELARKLQYAGSILRRVEQWAQGMGGAFTKLVFQPVKEAADRYRADRVVYRKRYQALVDAVAPALTKGLIAAPELNYTFGEGHNGIGHAELLHAILHTGNGSNKRKLLLGGRPDNPWATENADGTLNTDRWDAFLKRMHDTGVLTKAHYDFAQGVWDLLEQTKPLAQKTHRDVFGRYFAEVTADSFDTPFGSYTGGYVPAQADPRIVQDADLRKLAEAENENMSFSFPGTNKGFTKGRVEYNRPLMLDLRTIGQHLDKVLLFSHMEPAVRDVNKLLSRKGVSYSLGRIDPTIYAGMLTPWLSRSARQVVETPIVGDGGISRVMSAARARAGMALMFANLSNTLQQITGFSVAAIKVKPASMMRATATFIAAPKQTAKAVADASVFMANRMENEIAAINDAMDAILLDPNLYEKSQAWTQKHAYFLQTAMANTMEPIIWTAAYNDAIMRGDSDRDAVRHADSVIRTTQGSTLPEDVSRLETGPAWARLFTQFIGYFNMLANTNGTALLQVSREMGLKKGAGKALGIITLGMLAPIWVAEAIAHAMRGGPEDEDKDGYLDDWLMAVFGMGTIKGTFAMVPFLGQAAQLTVNRFNDNPADDKFSLSPAVSLIESTVSAPFSVYKAIADDGNRQKAVRDVASAVSIVTGLPAFAVARPLGYLAGVEQGKVEPTDALDLARGLVSGTASPASK